MVEITQFVFVSGAGEKPTLKINYKTFTLNARVFKFGKLSTKSDIVNHKCKGI